MPSISAGRPSKAAAARTSPVWTSARISVDETPSTSRHKTSVEAELARAAPDRPRRPRPKRKSAPARTTSRADRRRHRLGERLGSSARELEVEAGRRAPRRCPARGDQLEPPLERRDQIDPVPERIRGCGSNVTTVGVSPAARVASRTTRWPRWTPSNVPSATARGGSRGRSSSREPRRDPGQASTAASPRAAPARRPGRRSAPDRPRRPRTGRLRSGGASRQWPPRSWAIART